MAQKSRFLQERTRADGCVSAFTASLAVSAGTKNVFLFVCDLSINGKFCFEDENRMSVYQDRLGTDIGNSWRREVPLCFLEFFPCLSRAWLAKKIVFIYKWLLDQGQDLSYASQEHFQSKVKNGLFELFIYKMLLLPRQARDKHRESTQKKRLFCCSSDPATQQVRRKLSFCPLGWSKWWSFILSRQARHKHRKSTPKRCVFSQH